MSEEKFKFTEEFMQTKLSKFFTPSAVKYDIDGLYVFDWESDKLLETRSGYIYEFEIKVSKADFKNDFKHKKDKHIILEGEEKYEDKYIPKYYEYLGESKKYGEWAEKSFHKYNDNNPRWLVGGHKRPNYFYYAVPKDMIRAEDVPSYAGLVYVDEKGKIYIIKKAPCLHKEKYKDSELNLGEKFYYNMVKWRNDFRRQARDIKWYHQRLNEEIEAKGQSVMYHDLENKYNELALLNKETVDNATKLQDNLRKDLRDQCTINRRLVDEILKYNPEFDFWEFEKEIIL